MVRCAALLLLVLLVTPAAFAQQTFIETFDSGNEGGWTYGGPNEFIDPTGGNPGSYLHDPESFSSAPQPRTSIFGPHLFNGNFRERSISSIGIDLLTTSTVFGVGARPLTILLASDAGTPMDLLDDYAAYFIGPTLIPLEGEGWRSFDFDIPSEAMSLPGAWQFIPFGPNAAPDWNFLIENVFQVGFFYGDPQLIYISPQWDIGIDNPRITETPTPVGPDFIRGDIDGDADFNGLVDGVYGLSFQFIPGSPAPPCMKAADTDDNGSFNGLVDPLAALNFQFVAGSPPPPPPFPECGPDPTGDALTCDTPLVCP